MRGQNGSVGADDVVPIFRRHEFRRLGVWPLVPSDHRRINCLLRQRSAVLQVYDRRRLLVYRSPVWLLLDFDVVFISKVRLGGIVHRSITISG